MHHPLFFQRTGKSKTNNKVKRKLFHIVYLNLAFVLITLHISAQTGLLKGKVHSKNENLFNATISVGRKTIVTDQNGEFIMMIDSGSYMIMVSYTGYQVSYKNIHIKPGGTIELDFEMERIEHLNEVVV